MSVPLLALRGLSKRFGGVQALDGVTLTAVAGEVHGLVGPNGAGKSTLMGCISGLHRLDGGEIAFDGRRIDREPAHVRARLGIARTFQKIRLAQDLTVFENVAVGLAAQTLAGSAGYAALIAPIGSGDRAASVDQALAAAGIADLRGRRVASLPYGKRHLVELARCLAARPRLVLLDEPGTGLTTVERTQLGRAVRELAASGCLVVLVEHDLKLVGELCDRVTVLDYGRWIFTGPPVEAHRDPAVVRAYLGSAKFVAEPPRTT